MPLSERGIAYARRAAALLARATVRAATSAATPVFVLWALAYLGVNHLTRGHLDWAFRIRYRWLHWSNAAASVVETADVWHGHDMSALRAALVAQSRAGGRVVYDSHEILLDSSSYVHRPFFIRRVLREIEKRWVRRVDAMVTVNDMLAAELSARYEPRRMVVTHNCPPRPRRAGHERDLLRNRIGLAPSTPIAIYHGGLTANRGVEQMLDALLDPRLGDVHGVLMGYGPLREQYATAARDPRFGGRVHVIDAVPPSVLVRWLSTADVAVMPIQPSTLNHRLSTPNKLFEALAAGVPIVGSDFPGFRRIVAENPEGPLGILCDPTDPGAIAAALHRLVSQSAAERAVLRERCLTAATRRWNWQQEEQKLLALYVDIGASPAAPVPVGREAAPAHGQPAAPTLAGPLVADDAGREDAARRLVA